MTMPAGWYEDGEGSRLWWDGSAWTEHTQPPATPQQGGQPTPQQVAWQTRAGGPADAVTSFHEAWFSGDRDDDWRISFISSS